jgi:hypothetical protein
VPVCIWPNRKWQDVHNGSYQYYPFNISLKEGTKENPGVNYRALNELFRVVSERQEDYKVEITVSILEIYNEQIHDLLVPPQKAKQKK